MDNSDKLLKAALIHAAAVSLQAEMLGMDSLNRDRESRDLSQGYSMSTFFQLKADFDEKIDQILEAKI